jgi:hypothetical protein
VRACMVIIYYSTFRNKGTREVYLLGSIHRMKQEIFFNLKILEIFSIVVLKRYKMAPTQVSKIFSAPIFLTVCVYKRNLCSDLNS